jgi:hypothetical protein
MITTRKSLLLALIASASVVAGSWATGQEKGDLLKGVTFEQSKNEIQKEKEKAVPAQPGQSSPNLGPPFSCDSISDKSVHAACLSALEENFTYESERLKHRKWVFRFQLVATNISFVIVMAMIGFGLRFAHIQFSREFPRVSPPTPGDPPVPPPTHVSPITDIEVSLARIKVSSSILGVVILGLAMGFFYLYIRFIFPIQGVN